MTAARSSLFCLLALCAASSLGCSWSRFNDDTRDSPVVLLHKADRVSAFGTSMTAVSDAAGAGLFVAGSSGSLYDLGAAEDPDVEAHDTTFCDPTLETCFPSSMVAAIPRLIGPDSAPHERCFLGGAGSLGGKNGLIVRCADADEFIRDMPSAALSHLTFDLSVPQADDSASASDGSAAPSVLVSAATDGALREAWFYPPDSGSPAVLTPPAELAQALGADASYGATLAVLAVGGSHLYAVGAASSGDVLLFRSDGGSSSAFIGCLGGVPGFGRALASGKVNKDGDDDLVVSDASNVHVLDGRALAALPATASAECSFASLPAGALLGSFSCGSTKSLADCGAANFGVALAVGDLDGDGDGEVIVGAPGMTVRGKHGAGALLIYDVESPSDVVFADAKFLSSAEEGDSLGSGVAAAHVAGRDVIAASGPSNGKVAIFYCSALLAPGQGGARCP